MRCGVCGAEGIGRDRCRHYTFHEGSASCDRRERRPRLSGEPLLMPYLNEAALISTRRNDRGDHRILLSSACPWVLHAARRDRMTCA